MALFRGINAVDFCAGKYMKFTKMQGCGNDYVYINCFSEKVSNPGELAKRISDRRFGVGSDGLILIKPSEKADFTMEMYNADGTQGEMCGNAIRCVGKYVYEHSMTDKTSLAIETLAGIKYLELTVSREKQTMMETSEEYKESVKIKAKTGEVADHTEKSRTDNKSLYVQEVTVDMGIPKFHPSQIPVNIKGEQVVDQPIVVCGKEYRITAVSMGNPHAVVFVDSTKDFPVCEVGPMFEHHVFFPERVNTEFVEVLNHSTVRMRVWERGSGETWACGTGASATAVACILNGFTDHEVTVCMLGGDLRIRYDRDSGHVFMTGPAVTVFEGDYI